MSVDNSANISRWVVIYPSYLDKKKTVAEGRRVPLDVAVENPSLTEIYNCVKKLGFDSVQEKNKAYPRDYLLKGRLRVEFKKDGQLVNPEIKNRKQLYIKVCELIPQLTSRNQVQNTGKKKKRGK